MSTRISGLWLPLVTPFKDGAVDYASYERLVAHYIAAGVDGLFPLGTTGESPALDDAETEADPDARRHVSGQSTRPPVLADGDESLRQARQCAHLLVGGGDVENENLGIGGGLGAEPVRTPTHPVSRP